MIWLTCVLLVYLIEGIIDMAKIESNKFEISVSEFTVDEVIEDIENMFRYMFEQQNINFEVKVEQSTWERLFKSDKKWILQVLINILQNAIKF